MTAEETLLALEWERITTIAASLAASALGAERISNSVPLSSLALAQKTLDETSEMVRLLTESSGGFPIDGLSDVRDELKRASVAGSTLEPLELVRIADMIICAGRIKDHLRGRKEILPRLNRLTESLADARDAAKKIFKAIDPSGDVLDDASDGLKNIRREMKKEARVLESKMQGLLQQWSEAGYLQETQIHFRGGRLVLPVKDEAKHRARGMIVDQSASGATVFIEPLESLEISNKLRQLEIEEKREIHKILLNLTALIYGRLSELTITLEILSDLDELYARGRLALRWVGVSPELNSTGRVRIYKGRHPLLVERMKEKVVPLTVELEPPVRTLVISGPNAGGKTVALKTVGLLSLMAAAGYFVPAASGTELPFFESVYADIGDSQSIESDLSTFTGHLAKLGRMVRDSSSPKLILVDEIGSSTDPAIGSALAQSVLLELTEQSAISLVTTHHGSLKSFAHETEGMVNGSMAFNEQSLEPTYHFRPGIPGSSYALEIAQRVGFPQDLLDNARGYLGKGELGLEELVGELSRKIEEYERLRQESDLKLTKYEALAKLYEERANEIKKIKAVARKEALAEAEELVDKARRDMEQVIREIRESAAAKDVIASARKRLLDRRDDISKSQKQVLESMRDDSAISKPLETVAVGDRAAVEDLEGTGRIVAIQKNGKRVEIEMNGTRLWVDRIRLREPREPEKKIPQRVNIDMRTNTEHVPGSLDLRGKYGDEAIPLIDSYLTSAAQNNYKEVTLIHGKGTGALRVKVREFLEGHPLVKGYHDGGPNLNDFGSTAVELN